MQFEIKNELPR